MLWSTWVNTSLADVNAQSETIPFTCSRELHAAHHADSCASHGIAVEQDLGVIADLFDHPFDPLQCHPPVHGAKADVGAFAVAVGSLIDEEHPEAVFQIVIRKAPVVVQPFAGVAMETDDSLCPPVSRKICTVQLQTVL